MKRKRCKDCRKAITQTEGRGRPRIRCERCAWVETGIQKRASRLRHYGYPADVADHAARTYYDPPGVYGGGPR